MYAVIVQDLKDAISNLPNTPTAPFLGKAATAGAAKWLLAKVYLTRGWLNNSQADFQLAYNTAKDLIDNKATYGLDLWQNYADAFKPENDYGKETIFVTDHTNDPKYGFYNPGSEHRQAVHAINVTPWMGLFNAPSVARCEHYSKCVWCSCKRGSNYDHTEMFSLEDHIPAYVLICRY